MSNDRDLDAIFDRIARRTHTNEDIQILRQSVAITRNAQGGTIVTGNDNILGDNNTVQVGEYNINIAEGRDIHIGDKIYQSTDAETIRAIVQQVMAEKIRDETFQRLFPLSESSVDWDWGMKLLKTKQPMIRKRLTDTLGRDRILMDVSIEEQPHWVNRSPLAADKTLQVNGRDCGTLDANKMLIETFGRDDIEKKLLILGAPGAGKTTALLSLAEQLVAGAIAQSRTVIPIIFELSTWQNDNQSIESWLIEQLYDLHGGNRKSQLYEKWLERQVLLPLMDGLDELGLERQKKCTQKLNEFLAHYPHLVVCCRVKEFETGDIRLRNLRGAVCLQSLSDSQIQHYFNSIQRPELWGAILTTPYLQAMLEPTIEGDSGLLRVPLFVTLIADLYDPQQPISGKADLLDKYIDRQLSFDKREFDRRKELDDYTWAYKAANLEPDWKKTRSNLKWIAQGLKINNNVNFLIERIQPISINSIQLRQLYSLIFGLTLSLILNLSLGLLVGNLLFFLVFGILEGLLIGFFGQSSIKTIYKMTIGVILFTLNMPSVAGLMIFLVGDLNKIEPVESLHFSKPMAKENLNLLKIGIKNGINSMSIICLALALFSLLRWCLSPAIREKFNNKFSINEFSITLGLPIEISWFILIIIYFFLIIIFIFVCGGLIGGTIGLILGIINSIKQDIKIRLHPEVLKDKNNR